MGVGEGPSENEQKSETKEITKVACPRSFLRAKQKLLFSVKIGSQGQVVGTFSDKSDRFGPNPDH